MRRSLLVLVSAALTLVAVIPHAQSALPETAVVAGPGAWSSTYATPLVVYEEGGSVVFRNADLLNHDVVSIERGGDEAPWCVGYAKGDCPLFWTPLIGLGQSVPVYGLDATVPGDTYRYYCTLHPWMNGTLVATERLD